MSTVIQDPVKKFQHMFSITFQPALLEDDYESALGTATQHYMAMLEAATMRYFASMNSYLEALQRLLAAQETSAKDWLSGVELYQFGRIIESMQRSVPKRQPVTIDQKATRVPGP